MYERFEQNSFVKYFSIYAIEQLWTESIPGRLLEPHCLSWTNIACFHVF